tara:strand:+ start:1008 stop:1730 length:723 start_codon:yes stop_codon:yes gene_type:complete
MLYSKNTLERLQKTPDNASAQESLDILFLRIFQSLCQNIVSDAASASAHVVKLSENFLDEHTHQAFQKFHDLYFNSSEIQEIQAQVSQEVDDIIESVQTNDSAQNFDGVQTYDGIQTQDGAVSEPVSETSQAREKLADMQRQLESLVLADNDLQSQTTPIISSLQFVDMLQQNLQQLVAMWVIATAPDHLEQSVDSRHQELESALRSTLMLSIFYRTVLKKDYEITDSSMIDDLIFNQIA